MLPQKHRLQTRYDFHRVKRIGKPVHSRYFTLLYAPSQNRTVSRFGITASTKFDKRAVVRNRARRLLREAIREGLTEIKPGFDIILIAKNPIKNVKFQEVNTALYQALSKISFV